MKNADNENQLENSVETAISNDLAENLRGDIYRFGEAHLRGIKFRFPSLEIKEVNDYDMEGNKFSGKLENNLPEGEGKMIYTKTNKTFEGLFHEGKIQDQKKGKLTQIINNKSFTYIGEFKNGNPNGYGKFECNGKLIYEGMCKQSKKHGKGKLIKNDGSVYIGEFVEDKMHGKGILRDSKNHILYKGQWNNNKYHGEGEEYGNGIDIHNFYFKGIFKNNIRDGPGELTVYRKNICQTYKGSWVNGKREGEFIIKDLFTEKIKKLVYVNDKRKLMKKETK